MKIKKILSSILLIAILMQVVQPLSFAIENEIEENKVENEVENEVEENKEEQKEEVQEDNEELDKKQEQLDEDLKEPEQQEEQKEKIKEPEENIKNEDNENDKEEEKKEEIVQEKTETRGALKSPTKSPSNDENLVFQNEEFKQYLINNCNADTNNDGGISRIEIENIYYLSDAPDIEYPEYFINLRNISFKLCCTLDNAVEKQTEIEQKANQVAYDNCNWNIGIVKVDLGEIKGLSNDISIDLNEYFNGVLKQYPYEFDNYMVDCGNYDSGYSSDTDAIRLENNKVIIDKDKLGKFDMWIRYCMLDEYDSEQVVWFEFTWTMYAYGDDTREVEFADNTLRSYILDNYDCDNDGIITEFDMAQITELYMDYNSRFTSLSGLEYATNLKRLDIYMYNDNSDISQLAQLTSLEKLYIENGDVKGYIKDLPNLRELSLYYAKFDVDNFNNNITTFSYYGNYIANLEKIKNKENITSISLGYMGTDINYDFLGEMENLNSISISGNHNCSLDIDKLKDLENLTYISFYGVILSNINSFYDFESSITGLSIENCGLTSIEFIEHFPNLVNYISFQNNNITDISPLNGIFNNSSGYLNLKGNNINPDEEGNAAAIAYFNENDIYYEMDEYDESEEVIFNDENLKNFLLNSTYPKYDKNNDGKISVEEMKDVTSINVNNNVTDITGLEYATNLKEINFNSYNNAENIDLSPIYNLSQIEKISFSGRFYSIEGFNFLNNKTSLKELSIGLYNRSLDLDGIEQYTNLEKLNIGLNNYSNETRISNVQALNNLNKLTDLRISMTGGTIPTADIALASNIEHLELSGKLDDLSDLFSMHNLSYLKVDPYSSGKQNYDLTGIEELENLKTFVYYGEFDDISNITELNKIEGLEEIILSIGSGSMGWRPSGRVDAYKERVIKEQMLVDCVQNLDCDNIKLTQGTIWAYVGDIQVGHQKTIAFEDLSPIIRALMTPGNKLYNENIIINKGYGSGNNNVTIDSNYKTITINASNDLGEQHESLQLINSYGTDISYHGVSLLWRATIPGDTSEEIEFEDENLRNILLERYDIDGDNKITENDMINITELYIPNCNIHSLDGIENAVNLRGIYAGYNYISDISPIINLEMLQMIDFTDNCITDISCISNAKWSGDNYEEGLFFQNNFIDFEENNANYNALKKWLYLGVPEGRIPLMFKDTIITQNYGDVNDVYDEVELDENLKNRLIELGIDINDDGIFTRDELYRCENSIDSDHIDLSNCNIESISGLEFLNIGYINLSNNDIEDITPITKNQSVYNLDLSNNNVTSIEGIEKAANIEYLNLSNNNIENINPITNMYNMQADPFEYHYDYGYRIMNIDLSNNRINNISCVKNWKNIANLDLSNNHIGSISALEDYNFVVSEVRPDYINGSAINIDLSNNYINMENENNIQAKAVFDEKGATLIVDNQGILLGDINDDGKVNIKDWNRLYEHISEKRMLTEEEFARADINGDGKANIKDWNRMYEHISEVNPLW